MQTVVARTSAIVLFAVAGSGFTVSGAELTVSDAQRFHRLIKRVGPQHGFECHFNGFPAWRTRGVERAVPQDPEWHFVTPPETRGGLTTKLSRRVLRIRLEPVRKAKPKGFVFTWQKYDVVVVWKADIKLTAALIESLKNLDADAGEAAHHQ